MKMVWERCRRRAWVLHPDSRVKIACDCTVSAALIFVAIVVPMQAAFDDHFKPQWLWLALNLLCDVVFLADIYVASITGFFLDGMYIDDPAQIRIHYFRNRLVLDVIVATPFAWFVASDTMDGDYSYHSGTLTLVRALRMLRLLRVVPRLLRSDAPEIRGSGFRCAMARQNPSAARATQLLLLLLLATHWTGCLWWLVGTLNCSVYGSTVCDDGWGPPTELQLASFFTKYGYSFFWGASLMTGFVPFDVLPETPSQVWFTTGCLFVGLLMSIVTIASATSTLTKLDRKHLDCHHRLEMIKAFLRDRDLPDGLSDRILDFYTYRVNTSLKSSEEVDSCLKFLPPDLRVRLTLALYRDIIDNCVFFKSLSSSTAVALLQHLTPEVQAPGQLIIRQGDELDRMWLIRRGVVRVWVNFGKADQRVLATLVSNDYFGERALLKSECSILAQATVECVSYCDLLHLSRSKCEQVLEHLGKMGVASDDQNSRAEFGSRCDNVALTLREEQHAMKALSKLRSNSLRLDRDKAINQVDSASKSSKGFLWNYILKRARDSKPRLEENNRSEVPRLDLELAIQQVASNDRRSSGTRNSRPRLGYASLI